MKKSPKRTAEPVRHLSVGQLVGAPVKVVATIKIVDGLRACDVCDQPIDEEHYYHSHHDDDCPNRWADERGDDLPVDCECNNATHADCCPVCAEHVIVSHAPGKRVMWWTGTRLGWAPDPMIAHRYDGKARGEKALTGLRLRKHASQQRVQEVIPASLIERFEGKQ